LLPKRSRLHKRKKSYRARYASQWMYILRNLLMIEGKNKGKGPKYKSSYNKKMFKLYSNVLMQV
jgi:hypothetical protein